MKILVVADLAADREMLRRLAEDRRHAVRLAADGREAVTLVERELPDLIVLGLSQPAAGPELVAALHAARPGRCPIPLIVYAAAWPEGALPPGLRLVTRPAAPEVLGQAIDAALAAAGQQARPSQRDREWEATFDAIGEVITLHDPEMVITRINAAGCELFHARAADLIGKRCYELFTGLEQPCAGCPVQKALRDGQPHSREIRHQTLGKTFQVTATPLTDDEGRLIGVAHFARDITIQKELERQLRQAQKLEALGTLAGGIAHDFNNILAAIYGYGELLDMKLAEDSSCRQDLNQILAAAQRARDLVRHILAFSRSGEHVLEPLSVQLVVKEALKLLRASLPSTIAIVQRIDSSCRLVMADATQIHQVLMNLCANAFQAMRDCGGVLTVSLTERLVEAPGGELPAWPAPPAGAYVELTVADTGCGIPVELHDKIFEPYFTTKARGDGTGLGLSVAQGIVAGHGGHIGVESDLGRGASFHVYLPVMVEPAEEGTTLSQAKAIVAGNGERILLVDDEGVLVHFEERALLAYGYQVSAYASSPAAWEAFAAKPQGFDLLVTDMTMPGLTGMQLAEKVRALRPDLPIIVCTGFSSQLSAAQAAGLGIHSVLSKPLTMRNLVQTVRLALDAARAGR